MKVTYPVIFTDVDTNILIEVPDLGILTEANEEGKPKGTMADAMMRHGGNYNEYWSYIIYYLLVFIYCLDYI